MKSSNKRILKRMQKRDTKFMKTAIHGLHWDIQYLFELAVLLKQAKENYDEVTKSTVIDSIIELVDKYKEIMDEEQIKLATTNEVSNQDVVGSSV